MNPTTYDRILTEAINQWGSCGEGELDNMVDKKMSRLDERLNMTEYNDRKAAARL